jgi:hypothetical protein
MVKTLLPHVLLERGLIRRRERLGPIAGLPHQAMREELPRVDVVRAPSLHSVDDVGECDGRGEAEQCVNVVGRTTERKKRAPSFERLASEEREPAPIRGGLYRRSVS